MKKQLSSEQQAKRDERKAKFKTLWKQVAAMPDLERIALANKLGLVTAEGHALSLCNTMLVALQLPGASVLGGFRQWLKQGRCVRKGEHGAMIWCPTGRKQAAGIAVVVDGGNPDSVESMELRFVIGTVFDISQTTELLPAVVTSESQVAVDTTSRVNVAELEVA